MPYGICRTVYPGPATRSVRLFLLRGSRALDSRDRLSTPCPGTYAATKLPVCTSAGPQRTEQHYEPAGRAQSSDTKKPRQGFVRHWVPTLRRAPVPPTDVQPRHRAPATPGGSGVTRHSPRTTPLFDTPAGGCDASGATKSLANCVELRPPCFVYFCVLRTVGRSLALCNLINYSFSCLTCICIFRSCEHFIQKSELQQHIHRVSDTTDVIAICAIVT